MLLGYANCISNINLGVEMLVILCIRKGLLSK